MTGSDDLTIRLRRAEFNRALAEKSTSAISSLLSPNVIMVTGSDSTVLSGRAAQLKAWKHEFASPEPVTYVRTPTTIRLSQVEPIALELGEWDGRYADGTALAFGQYSAKWRKVGSDWVIVAEIFVTLSQESPYPKL